jgi:uncharacterized damage-inducible protein DinB
MHPRIQELADFLADRRARVRAAAGAVPAADRERRPAPEVWSAAEVLDHLAVVEAGIVRLLAKRVRDGRAAGTLGAETESSSILAAFDAAPLVDRSRAIEAPEFVRPRPGASAAAALAALDASRGALLDELARADGLALGTIVQAHAVLGPLTLYQWLLFLGHHEARHAEQLEEIAERLAR